MLCLKASTECKTFRNAAHSTKLAVKMQSAKCDPLYKCRQAFLRGHLALQADAETDSEDDVKLVPTAPPMHISLSTVLDGGGDLLSLEPPKWLPDSHAVACGICNQDFRSVKTALWSVFISCVSQTVTQQIIRSSDCLVCLLEEGKDATY